MRRSFLSPDETPRRELKIRREVEYFLTNFQVFYLVMKHYVELFILLLKKKKTKDAKISSFSSDFQTLTKLSWYFLYY